LKKVSINSLRISAGLSILPENWKGFQPMSKKIVGPNDELTSEDIAYAKLILDLPEEENQ